MMVRGRGAQSNHHTTITVRFLTRYTCSILTPLCACGHKGLSGSERVCASGSETVMRGRLRPGAARSQIRLGHGLVAFGLDGASGGARVCTRCLACAAFVC